MRYGRCKDIARGQITLTSADGFLLFPQYYRPLSRVSYTEHRCMWSMMYTSNYCVHQYYVELCIINVEVTALVYWYIAYSNQTMYMIFLLLSNYVSSYFQFNVEEVYIDIIIPTAYVVIFTAGTLTNRFSFTPDSIDLYLLIQCSRTLCMFTACVYLLLPEHWLSSYVICIEISYYILLCILFSSIMFS